MTDDQLNRLSDIVVSLDAADEHIRRAVASLDAIGPAPAAPTFGLRLALQQADMNINAATNSAMAAMAKEQTV